MKTIKIDTSVVFKVLASIEETYIVSGTISNYNKLTGIYTIKDKNNNQHLRAINKIWYDLETAQKTTDSGTFKMI